MMRQAWTQRSIFCVAALTVFFVLAAGAVNADTQEACALALNDGAVVSGSPAGLANGLLLAHLDESANSVESIRHIRQQMPAPHIPAEMLTEPSKSVDSALPVPEPTSLALLGGLGGLMFLIHRVRAYFDRRVAM